MEKINQGKCAVMRKYNTRVFDSNLMIEIKQSKPQTYIKTLRQFTTDFNNILF